MSVTRSSSAGISAWWRCLANETMTWSETHRRSIASVSRHSCSRFPATASTREKLSCRREAARCFASLNISLSHSRSFNVIRNDTIEQGTRKCQLVFHCRPKYITLVPFLRYSTSNNGVTLKSELEITQVIDNGTNQKVWYGFLFAFHSNCGRFDTIHERDGHQTPRVGVGRAYA